MKPTEAGVARMKPVDAVVIAPNGRLELKPGGYHLMLSGLTRPLKEGEALRGRPGVREAGTRGRDFHGARHRSGTHIPAA